MVALALVAACEAGARRLLAGDRPASAYEARFPPHHQRAFEAYTAPPRTRPPGPLVIVISNSQGALVWPEDGRAERLFATGLEQLLGGGARVLNWSLVGGNGAEMVVLAARAGAHRPDAVLLVAGGLGFAGASATQPLADIATDVDALAYLPAVRAHLPDRFLRRHNVREPSGWLSAHAGLVRWRHRHVEQRRGNWNAWDANRVDVDFVAGVRAGRRGPGRRGNRTAGPWTPLSDALVEDFRATLRSAAPEARLVVVGQPVCWFEFAPEADPALAGLVTASRRLFAGDPSVRVVDLQRSLPADRFYTWSHLLPRGHAELADLLLPHARWALER